MEGGNCKDFAARSIDCANPSFVSLVPPPSIRMREINRVLPYYYKHPALCHDPFLEVRHLIETREYHTGEIYVLTSLTIKVGTPDQSAWIRCVKPRYRGSRFLCLASIRSGVSAQSGRMAMHNCSLSRSDNDDFQE